MLTVGEIRDMRALAGWRGEWERLEAAASFEDLSFFQSYVWNSTWLEAFWQQRPLSMVTVSDADTAIALAPFVHDRAGNIGCPGCQSLPVNAHVYRGFVLCPGELGPLLGPLLDHAGQSHPLNTIAFKEIERDGRLHRAVEDYARLKGMGTVTHHASYSPWIDLRDGWDAYLARRTRHVRRELRRKRKNLARAGAVELDCCPDDRALDACLNDVFTIEGNSWKHTNGSAFTSRLELAFFYRRLAERCHRRGWLRVYLLRIDQTPVAHIFCALQNGCLYAIKTSFDEHYRPLSPGAVLFGHAIEDACNHGIERIALLGTRSRWKDELSDYLIQQVNVCVFPAIRVRCRHCRFVENELRPYLRRHKARVLELQGLLRDRLPRVSALLQRERAPRGPLDLR